MCKCEKDNGNILKRLRATNTLNRINTSQEKVDSFDVGDAYVILEITTEESQKTYHGRNQARYTWGGNMKRQVVYKADAERFLNLPVKKFKVVEKTNILEETSLDKKVKDKDNEKNKVVDTSI